MNHLPTLPRFAMKPLVNPQTPQRVLQVMKGGGDPPFTATFLAVKLLDIGLVTMYFFILGLAAAKVFDFVIRQMGNEDYEKTPLGLLFLEITIQMVFIGIIAYILRNIVGLIPFPLNGVGGFQHSRLKELDGGEVLAIALIMFQTNLYDKVIIFVNRFMGIKVMQGGVSHSLSKEKNKEKK